MRPQLRRAGLRHRGGRDKTYQEDTAVEANEEAAVRRKQLRSHPIVNCSKTKPRRLQRRGSSKA